MRTSDGTDKPLMLLLHGFPELWTMWKHQMNAFRNDYNVAAFDMRGYGQSDRPMVRSHPYIQMISAASQREASSGDLMNSISVDPVCQAATREAKSARRIHAVAVFMQARRDYYIDVLVKDVVAVVHGLGYKKCVLGGHDWYASRHPLLTNVASWLPVAQAA